MENFIIITDGCGDLTIEQRAKYNIERPITAGIVWPDGSLREADVDWKNITPDEYFKLMTDKKNTFKSSLPAPGQIYERLEPFCQAGQNIFISTLSGGLSGTYNAFIGVANELMEKYPNIKIHVLDCRRYGGGIALAAINASLLRSQGLPFDEVVAKVEEMKLAVHQCGMLDDLYYLNRVGRISKTAAVMGTMIGIKPLAEFDNESGQPVVITKARGEKKFFATFLPYIEKTIGNPENKVFIVTHSFREVIARKMESLLKEKYPNNEIIFVPLGQVDGANVGPGLVATFYCGDEPVSKGCEKERDLYNQLLGK